MDVYLTVFDKEAFAVSAQLLGDIETYIDEHYVDERLETRLRRKLLDVERDTLKQREEVQFDAMEEMAAPASLYRTKSLDDLMDDLDDPFGQTLIRLISAKGKTETEVYKRANIDRRLFSKIKNGKMGYTPGKRTIAALAVALELNLEETGDLLRRAGFALSHNQKFDVIIEYFIVNGQYDIFEINEVLFHYDQPLLGL